MCILNELQQENQNVRRRQSLFSFNRGDDGGLTEWYSEDTKEMAAISCAKGEQRLSSRRASAPGDKCLPEGCPPSYGILMVGSCHPLPSQVVHEALRHARRSGPSLTARPHSLCRSPVKTKALVGDSPR